MLHGRSTGLMCGAGDVGAVAKAEIGLKADQAGSLRQRRLGEIRDLGRERPARPPSTPD